MKELKISRPVITQVAGEDEVKFVNDPVFLWEIEINSKYHMVVENITLKELRIIPESVSPGLKASLKNTTDHADDTTSIVAVIDIEDFMQIISKSDVLDDLKVWTNGLTGSLSSGDLLQIALIHAAKPPPRLE